MNEITFIKYPTTVSDEIPQNYGYLLKFLTSDLENGNYMTRYRF